MSAITMEMPSTPARKLIAVPIVAATAAEAAQVSSAACSGGLVSVSSSGRGTSSPSTPLTPLSSCLAAAAGQLSRSSSQLNVDTDSGKSSCSPALLDCSFDSGIGAEVIDPQLHKRIRECKRILIALERDKEAYRKLRERLSKIVDRKSKKHKIDQKTCNVCCAEIDLSDARSFVECSCCNKHVCRGIKCADWVPGAGHWECQLCHSSKESLAQTQSWVAEQMSFNQQKLTYPMRARSEIYIPITDSNDCYMQFESVSQIGINSSDAISSEQKLRIREYVEEIVANMLGGSLDSIKVSQMSKSENYLPAVANGHLSEPHSHNNNHGDFLDISQSRLKQLIEAIIAETLHRTPNSARSTNAVSEIALDTRSNGEALPQINGHARRHRVEHYFEPSNYQDLLATAVLNKIVDKQNNTRIISESTPDLHRQFNVENQSITSGSSVEPRSDSSLTDTEQILDKNDEGEIGRESALSDYVASHMVPLPDFSTPATESEEDDYGSVHSGAPGEGTWEDNWLFKKKRTSPSNPLSTGSLSMLVPAPKEDVRAQIGDKTTDEVSDLSELDSDIDTSLEVMQSNLDPLNDRLLNKHLIGGQNTKMILDELMDSSSMISNTSVAEHDVSLTETLNVDVCDAVAKTEAVNANIAQQQHQTTADNPSPLLEVVSHHEHHHPDTTDPLSGQLSSDSSQTDESTPTIIETYQPTNDNGLSIVATCTLTRARTNTKSPPACKVTTNTVLTNGYLASAQQSKAHTHLKSAHTEELVTIAGDSGSDSDGSSEGEGDGDDDDDVALSRRFMPGSIAEREYKKWNNAVEMPNNPYAPEALKQRISGSQEKFIDLPNISPRNEKNPIEMLKAESDTTTCEQTLEADYKRYSRDYYINDVQKARASPQRQDAVQSAASNRSSDEPHSDAVIINEAETKNKTATSQPNPQRTLSVSETEKATEVYQALPVQVVEEPVSIETLSGQSLQSVNTTTSDDSDTVRIYDFNKQETTTVSRETRPSMPPPTEQVAVPLRTDSTVKRERPTELALGSAASGVAFGTPITPSRGSTPTAFKFLQPKRKLIEPSQVLSFDEDEPQPPTPVVEKKVIEQEVAQVMPSVKALAQAFLLTSSRNLTQSQRRWASKARSMPETPRTPFAKVPACKLETSASIAVMPACSPVEHLAKELRTPDIDPTTAPGEQPTDAAAAIAIHESSLEETTSPADSCTTPVRAGVLKNNIAFFENLKNQ